MKLTQGDDYTELTERDLVDTYSLRDEEHNEHEQKNKEEGDYEAEG
jgi:hypothetical protein